MKTPFLLTGLTAIVSSLSSCAHMPADFHSGYYVQRSQNNYEFIVANGAPDPADYFYHGAYYVCSTERHSGFEVIVQERDSMGSINGTVTCKGELDKFLEKKYAGTTVKTEPSEFMAPGCFHYEVIPAVR